MNRCRQAILEFMKEEDGPTSIEYAVMLGLIIVVCLTAVATLGNDAVAKFCAAADVLAN
jgi:pilus assembly protein Flp/PilA